MENNNLNKKLAELTTSEDPSRILKLLIDIRKQVDWPRNKDNITNLRKHNHFRTILDKLTTSKRSIIDVILSILGNCCLDSRCSRDLVIQFNIFSNLNQILKRYPKEDSINGRIFRIIGNICVHKEQLGCNIIEKKPQIVMHIVHFLKNSCTDNDDNNKVTDATIIMGIRALRELLNRESLKSLIEVHDVMKIIGMLLIKYSDQYASDNKNEAILTNLIKILIKYSNYKYYPIITQLKNTESGDALYCLPKILLFTPKQIIRIVMNFLEIIHRMSELPIKELFECFNQILSNDGVIEEFNQTTEECVRCLCKLLEHPSNRNVKRCGNTVTVLVEILQKLSITDHDNNRTYCCILIISTLNSFKYEENLLLDQIKANILNVLTQKLLCIVGGLEPFKVDHINDKKRKSECGCMSLIPQKQQKTVEQYDFAFLLSNDSFSSDYDYDDDEGDSSISENVNSDMENYFKLSLDPSDLSFSTSNSGGIDSDSELTGSYTSGLSPVSSPQRLQNYQFSESDSDDYSPICSDVDDDGMITTPLEMDEVERYSDLQDLQQHDDDNQSIATKSLQQIIGGVKMTLLIEIVNLLKSYSKLRPAIVQLANRELLLCLIKSTNYFDWSLQTIDDIIDVIDRILLLNDYLLPLMQTDFIQFVHDMSYIQHDNTCSKCRHLKSLSYSIITKLSIVAESGVGRGDIAHKLLRGDVKIKQLLVIVLPYIILTKSILIKFMLNCGGLDVLMRLLRDENEIKERTIKALCLLAEKRLGIVNPMKIKNHRKSATNAATTTTTAESAATQLVAFKLDDGSVLEANRKLLSDNSDFFQRLLNGDFRESRENEIQLHNVINKSFKYLLRLIECNVIDENLLINIDIDLITHLDIIALCDRFLMQNYCFYLTSCVEKYHFNATTIPLIYQWSVESGTNLLRVECIAYALVARIVDAERVEMFKCLFDLGYTDELINDIRTLLVRHLHADPFEVKKKRKRPKRYIMCHV